MAYYVPQFGSCFGAGCSDIFPGDAPAPAPALSPYPTSPDVSVDVSVQGGGYGPRGEIGPGGAMIAYGPGAPASGLPWWLWLVIGYLVAKAVKGA